ncbi:LysR family transcriptional regulator [Clostridium paraputrificum]|uniref:LysR family transcriptional regulator n=1 Tax=Clostridium paraputrificum TaxID=29363 RepID=UPI003D34A563
MEINDLRIFQIVAYEKSISKAALSLGYAQSNITMRIKVLENELNTTLFIRNNKGTTITTHGEKLLQYADKIIKLVDEATEEFIIPKINSKLTIGATQTISASRLPKLFTLFHEKNPTVSLVLKTEKQEVLFDKLIKDELDGAFIYDNYTSINVKEIFSFIEEIALISSTNINDTSNITTPIIVNTDNQCPYGQLLKKWFAINNSNPTTIIEFDTLESILNGVTAGLGVSLLPKNILPEKHNFHVYDLRDDFKALKVKFVINEHGKFNDSLKSFIGISNEYINI